MPQSQFIQNLIQLKNDKNEKLENNLMKDLKEYGNLNRIFNDLPRSLCSETFIEPLEKNYLNLYHDTQFSKKNTIAVYDTIIFQAHHDLLDETGSLHPDLINCLNLNSTITKNSADVVFHAVSYSYLEYITELLANKTNKKLAEKKEPTTDKKDQLRSTLIFETFKNISKNLDDYLKKITFMKKFRKISLIVCIENEIFLNELSSILSKYILLDFQESQSALQQHTAMNFWLEAMHISLNLGDYNTFFTIYTTITRAKKNYQTIRNPSLMEKIEACTHMGNSANNYANLLEQTKKNIEEEKAVIPAHCHLQNSIHKIPAKYANSLSKIIEPLFMSPVYNTFVTEKNKKYAAQAEQFQSELKKQRDLLKPFFPKKQPGKTFFTAFSNIMSQNTIEKLYKHLEENKYPSYDIVSSLIDQILGTTTSKTTEEKSISTDMTSLTPILQKIKQLSAELYRLGVDWNPAASTDEEEQIDLPVFSAQFISC